MAFQSETIKPASDENAVFLAIDETIARLRNVPIGFWLMIPSATYPGSAAHPAEKKDEYCRLTGHAPYARKKVTYQVTLEI